MKNSQNGETLFVFCMAVLAPFLSFLVLPMLILVLGITSIRSVFNGK